MGLMVVERDTGTAARRITAGQGVTRTTPVMVGWMSQKYANSPGSSKVWLKRSPGAMSPESKTPSSVSSAPEVTVCLVASPLAQVTVVPTEISSRSGTKTKFSMETTTSIPEPSMPSMSWLAMGDELADGTAMDRDGEDGSGGRDAVAGGELGEPSAAGAQAARSPTRPSATNGSAYRFMEGLRAGGRPARAPLRRLVRPMFYTHGWVHVIAGCMFCGKTDEMLRLLRRFSIAGRRVVLVKPRLDTRTDRVTVVSRSGAQHQAVTVDDSSEIDAAAAGADIVAVEEGQFFDERLPEAVERLAKLGKQVIVTGLDRDFRGVPFGTMPRLLALADQVTKLTAICVVCGEPATRTQRLIDGQPAPADSPLIVIGGMGDETYEARCRLHHEVPAGAG